MIPFSSAKRECYDNRVSTYREALIIPYFIFKFYIYQQNAKSGWLIDCFLKKNIENQQELFFHSNKFI